MAVLMLTNTGSVTVKIFPDIRVDTRTNFRQFAPPLYSVSAGSLRPGEAGFFQAFVLDPQQPWWTELAYCRYGLRMRLHDKLWNTGNSVAPGLMEQLSPSAEKHWVQSGWITNSPPLFAVPGPRQTIRSWAEAFVPIEESVRWEPHGRYEGRPMPDRTDLIDASRPRSRFHLTAPPDWKDVDFSDLSFTKR